MCVCVCVFVLLVKLSFILKKRKKFSEPYHTDVACSHTAWNFDPTAIDVEISHEFTDGRV